MKVILLYDVDGLGKTDDIVEVNDGYARNFLLKRKMALEATASNLNSVQVKKGAQSAKAVRAREEAQSLASKLSGRKVVLEMKSGEGGKLYGAVTTSDIASALSKIGYPVDKKNVTIKSPIKGAGEYEVAVKLHSDISAKVTVEVITVS